MFQDYVLGPGVWSVCSEQCSPRLWEPPDPDKLSHPFRVFPGECQSSFIVIFIDIRYLAEQVFKSRRNLQTFLDDYFGLKTGAQRE